MISPEGEEVIFVKPMKARGQVEKWLLEVEENMVKSLWSILKQGLNRQIRRMCEYLGYRVTRLKRVRIMNVKLDVPVGQWRDLTKKELREIRRLTADSSKNYEEE